jgi:hypothetical protein
MKKEHEHAPWEKCIPIGIGQMAPDEPVLEYRNCPECHSTITREVLPSFYARIVRVEVSKGMPIPEETSGDDSASQAKRFR